MAGKEGKDEEKLMVSGLMKFMRLLEISIEWSLEDTRQLWGKYLGSFVGHVSSKVWFLFFLYLYIIDYIIMYISI